MNAEKNIVRYRNSEFEIEDTDGIRSNDIIQEHPVI